MNDIPMLRRQNTSLNANILKMLEPAKKGRGRPKKQHSDFDEESHEIDDVSYANIDNFRQKSTQQIVNAVPTARQKQTHIQPQTGGVLKKALLEVRGKHINDTKVHQSRKVSFQAQDDQNQEDEKFDEIDDITPCNSNEFQQNYFQPQTQAIYSSQSQNQTFQPQTQADYRPRSINNFTEGFLGFF